MGQCCVQREPAESNGEEAKAPKTKHEKGSEGWAPPQPKPPRTTLEKWQAKQKAVHDAENVSDCGSVHSGWGPPKQERQLSLGLISLGSLGEHNEGSGSSDDDAANAIPAGRLRLPPPLPPPPPPLPHPHPAAYAAEDPA